MKKYIAYYRVSTVKQGLSGLGLEAQRNTVSQFVKDSSSILKEFIEIESGKSNNRIQLHAAIESAKIAKATLVIAKLDRLSRNASFILTLKDSGVDFICADMPDANTLTIGIFATLAQHEREIISARTKAALQAKKKQGFKLGKPENLPKEAGLKASESLKEKARNNENNRRAAAMIKLFCNQGMNWLNIAQELNQSGFKTSQGKSFQAVQVQRLYKRWLTP